MNPTYIKEDFGSELIHLFSEEVSKIRQALEDIKECIHRLEQKHIRIEAECEICRTARAKEMEAVTIRLHQMENWQGTHETHVAKRNDAQWTAASKVVAALIGLLAAVVGSFFMHITQQ